LRGDGGVNATGVDLNVVELIGREGGDGAVGSGTKLQCALYAVMLKKTVSEDLGEFSGSMAAQDVHLEETVLRGDEALREGQIVE